MPRSREPSRERNLNSSTVSDKSKHSKSSVEKRAISKTLWESVQERYRNMLGENYAMFEKTLAPRLNQQVVDKTIADTLLTRAASSYDMHTGTTEVQKTIMTQLFPENK